MPTSPSNSSDQAGTRPAGWWGLGAALAAAVGAGLCCAGPFVYLVFGVSAAAFSGWPALDWLQLPLTIVSALCLLLVFLRLYARRKPVCVNAADRFLRPAFWLTTVLVMLLVSYPYVLPWLLA